MTDHPHAKLLVEVNDLDPRWSAPDYVIGLARRLAAALETAPPTSETMTDARSENAGLVAKECWSDLLDKDDRNSPPEYPEMALITKDELTSFVTEGWLRALETAPPTPPSASLVEDQARIIWLALWGGYALEGGTYVRRNTKRVDQFRVCKLIAEQQLVALTARPAADAPPSENER